LSSIRIGRSPPPSQKFVVRFAAEADFTIDVEGRRITVSSRHALDSDTLTHLFADQVLPRVLAHEGALVVHGGAVQIGPTAIAVVGRSGQGKSTLVASFGQSGHAILGDDALIVSSLPPPTVSAVYPSLRLFPDSLDAVYTVSPEVSAVAHYSTKRRVAVPARDDIAGSTLPLSAIFTLAPTPLDGRIAVRKATPVEACMTIVEQTFALDPADPREMVRRFTAAAALANTVPAFAISYPRDYHRLPEVQDMIVHQLADVARAG
jgi:hypothetical protein